MTQAVQDKDSEASRTSADSVLIVDSDPAGRDHVAEYLRRRGWEPRIAATPEDALKLLEHELPTLVLFGLMFPKMSGMEFLSKVRQDHRSLPMVVATKYYTVEIAIEAMRAGADDYLGKPLNFKDQDADGLDASLRAVLKRRSQGTRR